MVIKSYHIILAVKILGWFLLKWAGFGELLGWKSSTRSGNTDFVSIECSPKWRYADTERERGDKLLNKCHYFYFLCLQKVFSSLHKIEIEPLTADGLF